MSGCDATAAATRFPITPDDFELLLSRVGEALATHDLVLVNAGSSAGSEDFTSNVVERLGSLQVHGVAIRPGHPLILGVAQGKPIVGIPGYPVSAVLTSELFVRPLVYRLLERLGEAGSSGLVQLQALAGEAGTAADEAFIAQGRAMLERMRAEGTLLGTLR